MFRHVVMFKWNDDVDQAHIDEFSETLTAVAASVPEVGDFRHGPDLQISDGNYDYVIVGEYASVDDYAVYRDHPGHKALIEKYLAGSISARAAVQYDAG